MADSYEIRWKRSALKELKRLPKPDISRILRRIEQLPQDPFPTGVRKLAGAEQAFRLRVGRYRIVYRVFGGELVIEIVRVRHRKDAYRR